MSVPYVFTVHELLDHFRRAGPPTPSEGWEALTRLDRNDEPLLLDHLLAEGLLTSQTAARCVSAAWCGCDYPNLVLPDYAWRRLFRLAGYTVECSPADRPHESLQLYRGAVPAYRRGWSWTEDRELAQWFADRARHQGPGLVWVARVAPWRLLARITAERRGESEYVVDTYNLRIVPSHPA